MTLSGAIRFDRVPFSVAGRGLDYSATVGVTGTRGRRGSPSTRSGGPGLGAHGPRRPLSADCAGRHGCLPPRARPHAKRKQRFRPVLGLQVLNNTNGNARYVLDGTVFNTGAANGTLTRDLRAPSGWPVSGGTSYVSTRSAAPFAILDTMYSALQFVQAEGDPSLAFQELDVYWSPLNRSADGNPAAGEIVTTSFVSAAGFGFQRGIYVLGDDGIDTDEYDEPVLVHEFHHFLEDTVSRTESPGGPHLTGELLDMRVAFSEGMSNAFSAMALGDPVYRDSFGSSQSFEFGFNMEANNPPNAGWFNEGSVHSVAWDLFDSGAEGGDVVALGYAPILDVMRNEVRVTPALTSIFPFVTALKQRAGVDAAAVDALVQAQDIVALGIDTFAGTETNDGGIGDALPVYTDIALNQAAVTLCGTPEAGIINKLGNRRFLSFSVPSEREIEIRVAYSSGATANPDPDLVLYRSGFFAISQSEVPNLELFQQVVPAGNYVLEIYEFSHIVAGNVPRARTCMNVTVNG